MFVPMVTQFLEGGKAGLVSLIHFVVWRAFMAGAASQAGDADSSRVPGLPSGLQGP